MNFLEKLEKLNLELPSPTAPGGNYDSITIRNDIAYIAIQFPILNNQPLYQGKLGGDLSTRDGYKALGICALNVLSHLSTISSMDQLVGLNHVEIYYQATETWDEGGRLADGASDLFVQVLAEKGRHSRAIFGVERLPKNFSVGLTATCTLASTSFRPGCVKPHRRGLS
ncbi:RidA family protein [Parapedobacter pyrenivorans]|uniref:RidA family protein n=1 Tax=Parapedobacter pyrenivorans TaxID=1305674 RepID=UPI003340F107